MDPYLLLSLWVFAAPLVLVSHPLSIVLGWAACIAVKDSSWYSRADD